MTTDATDLALIFLLVIIVLVIAFLAILRSACRAFFWHGVLWEKRRRRKLGERVEEAIEDTFESAKWEKELDV